MYPEIARVLFLGASTCLARILSGVRVAHALLPLKCCYSPCCWRELENGLLETKAQY